MGRKSSFTSIVIAAARASSRAAKHAEVARRRDFAARQRQAKVYAREAVKSQKEAEKAAKQEYLEMRVEEAGELTKESEELYRYLKNGVLTETFTLSHNIRFNSLKPTHSPPVYTIPKDLTIRPQQPCEDDYVKSAGKQPFLGNLFISLNKKWLVKIENAKIQFQNDFNKWEKDCKIQEEQIKQHKKQFEEYLKGYEADYKSKCSDIDEFKSQYLDCNTEAVTSYISLVLDKSDYNIEWDREFQLAYSPESKELVIEYKLPNSQIVPLVSEYRYIKTKDQFDEKPRKKTEIELCYKSFVSSMALRTIYEIIKSDQGDTISNICFNGYVISTDLSTGKIISPKIISVSAAKPEFEKLELNKVDPIRCIQGLSASLSPSPYELIAIKPIREFSMVDKRFVEEQDILSSIDMRPNLMDLDPFEFENLVSNLFSKMGLETKQTRTSKDGGVDAIAFDTRPVLGGKLVIQAKRYKNTVGVSAARDLYGTMINEGASKGILVATSSYGSDTFEFAKDKPIELIDGTGLLFLLDQVGIKARIIIPPN